MEKLEEIENFFKKEIEAIDKSYLEDLKNKKDKKKLDPEYRSKLYLIKEKYEKRYNRYLEDQKKMIRDNLERKKNLKNNSRLTKFFTVTKINLKPTFIERLKTFYEKKRFTLYVKKRAMISKFVPLSLFRLKFYFKMKKKRFFLYIKESISNFFNITFKSFKNIFNFIKNLLINIFIFIKNIVLFFIMLPLRLFIKKKPTETNDNKEEKNNNEEKKIDKTNEKGE